MVQNVGDLTGVPEDTFVLENALKRLLDAVEAVFEARNIPLPERRYWTFAAPAEDCAQVVVYFLQQYLGSPGDQANAPQRCDGPRSAVVNIDISRSYPIGNNGQPVNTGRIMEASRWTALDVTTLMDSIKDFDQWAPGIPGPGAIATVTVLEPSGGVQTTRMNLTFVVG